jgi:hypothetical protein
MKKVYVNRLLKLADYLMTVPKREFNLYGWKCGTTACACGHACSIPSFRRAGLSIDMRGKEFTGIALQLKDERLEDFVAVEAFFGLNREESLTLFHPGKYDDKDVKKPRLVAKRIRELVKAKQA